MHLFFKKLILALKPVLESHAELSLDDAKIRPPTHDQNKTVGVAEFKCGNIFLRIVQVDDKGKLFSAEFYRDWMTRMKLTHVAPDTLIEFIAGQIEAHGKPDYVERSYAKGLEPVLRTEADIEELTEDELDQALNELAAEINAENRKSGMPDSDSDEMHEWDAKAEYKNLVQTFARGEIKEEPERTPKKVYRKDDGEIEKQTPDKGKVSWGGASRLDTKTMDNDQLPVRLSEAVTGKVLCDFGYPHGVQFVDKELYEEVMSKKLKPSWNAETGMVEYVPANQPTVRASFKPRSLILRNQGKA